MAIQYVNKSTFASGTGALSVAAVANVQAGDLLLLFVESANEAVTLPSGYTELTNSPVSTGTAGAAGGVRLSAYYRIANGADTTTAIVDSGNHTTAIKVAYRNVDTVNPFDATPVSGTKTPASTSVNWPSVTTATDNAWVVLASALDLDANSTATTSGYTNANLTGLTERHDQTVNLLTGGGLVIADGIKTTAGATGTTTATVTSTIQVYLTIALREDLGTGTLAATETGNDTFSATGTVLVQGALAATETGSDVFAATGSVLVQGSLAASETGSDSFAATGSVLVQGALAVTETGDDTLAASGTVLVSGALAATETGNDTAYINGGDPLYVDRDYADYDYVEDEAIPGSMAATETGNDSFSASGTVVSVVSTGDWAATETGDDTLAASGRVLVSGTLAATETLDTLSASGTVLVSGTMAADEADVAYTGIDYWNGDYADGDEVGSDSFAAVGDVVVTGTLAVSETGSDTFAATGAAPVQGSLAATEFGDDGINGHYVIMGYVAAGYAQTQQTGQVIISGAAILTELLGDAFSGEGQIIVQGALAASEAGSDTFWAVGSPLQPADAFLISGDARSFTLPGDARTFATTGNQRVFTVQ